MNHSKDIHDVTCSACGNTQRTMVEYQGYYWCATCNTAQTPQQVHDATARVAGRNVAIPATSLYPAS